MKMAWIGVLVLVRLARVQRTLRRSGFHESWRRFALQPVAGSRRVDPEWLIRLTHASGRLRFSCLPRALTLCSLLRERGVPAEVKIGVRREGAILQAHAWVALRGEVLGETLHPDWRILPMEQAAAAFEKVAAPTS